MAKIPLRAYIKEIENLIERGEIEQAVAHARNILKSYPKHIDTYRLLGKAFLESQRYSEAADILQRVLSVMPDDFISQIGMSIIREDEGNLDAAIWHMERAYEVQPFNPAVQDELRRLYGRRDGIEPPKIRLTRGALVRMYARGELYPQAIAETRAALAEDLQRFDLRVLLARLYYLSGHKNDAAEVCSELISKLPYCYEANRLLAEILPTTSRAEDAKKFQQRIYSLDPYEAFISPVSPSSDQVPDQAVMMEQFIWDASTEGTQTPEWTRSIGVQWEETEEENLPDWLNNLQPEPPSGFQAGDHQAAVVPTPEETETGGTQQYDFPANETALPEQDTSSEEVVPSWLKDAGWSASDKTADEIMALQEESPAEEIVPAEIPDWIQSIAPREETLSEEESTETTEWLDNLLQEPSKGVSQQTDEITSDSPTSVQTESESLDWLDDLTNEPLSGKIETENISEPSETNELPDWLSNMQAENKIELPQETGEGEPSDLPASWLETGESEPEAKTPHFNEVPDWLNSLDADFSEQSTAGSDVPDWLSAIKDESGDSIAEPAQTEVIETTSEPDTSAAMPDWLTQLQNNPDAATILPQETVDFTSESETEDTSAELSDVDSAMAWLQSLTPHQDVVEETPVQSGEVEISTEAAADEAVAEPMSSSVFQSTAETILPETEAQTAPAIDSQPAAETPDFSDMDAAMAWLESLAAKQGADEATLITPPDQRTDTPPEWVLNEIDQQTAVSDETMAEETLEIDQAAAQESAAAQSTEDFTALISDEIEAPAVEEPVVEVSEQEASILEHSVQETSIHDEPARVELPESEAAEQLSTEMDMDEAFAWLESLAAKQGADEETLITAPDERSETPPEWVQQQETADMAQPKQSVVDLTNEEPAAQEEEPVDAFNELADQSPADETPDWLMALEDESSGRESEILAQSFLEQFEDKAAPSEEQIETQGIVENAEINPESWLSGGEEPAVDADKAAEEHESMPDWLKSETIEQPAQSVQPENLPEWLFGIEENAETETPSNEEEIPVVPAEYHSEWEPEVNTEPSKQEPIPAPTRAEAGVNNLSALQDAISHGDLDNALGGYNRMINEGVYLEETIRDLRDALYRYPVDISIWQVLGDAYARNNQLQEALDAYTKAEELLR